MVRYGIDFTYAQKAGLKKSWERDRWRSAVDEVATTMGCASGTPGRSHPIRADPAGVDREG